MILDQLFAIGDLVLEEVRAIELEHGAFVEKIYLLNDLVEKVDIDDVFDKEDNLDKTFDESFTEELDFNTTLVLDPLETRHEKLKDIIATKLMIEILKIESFETFAQLVLEKETDMNFVIKRKRSDYISSFLLVTTVALLVVNIGLGFVENKYEKTKAESVKHQISVEENLNELNSQAQRLDSEIESYQRDIDMVSGIKNSKVWLSNILYVLSDETPDGVAVKNLNVDKDITRIEGYAKDYTNIGFLSLALEKYGEVHIEEMDLEDDDVTINNKDATKNFTIMLRGNNNYEY